jgi:hypothetical protein
MELTYDSSALGIRVTSFNYTEGDTSARAICLVPSAEVPDPAAAHGQGEKIIEVLFEHLPIATLGAVADAIRARDILLDEQNEAYYKLRSRLLDFDEDDRTTAVIADSDALRQSPITWNAMSQANTDTINALNLELSRRTLGLLREIAQEQREAADLVASGV